MRLRGQCVGLMGRGEQNGIWRPFEIFLEKIRSIKKETGDKGVNQPSLLGRGCSPEPAALHPSPKAASDVTCDAIGENLGSASRKRQALHFSLGCAYECVF